jgi:glycosyltransferase involved in cell wall biosynthesis
MNKRIFPGREFPHKIKILRIIARLNIGGPAIHVYLLSEGLNKKRFQSMIITGKISRLEGDMSYLFEPSEGKFTVIPELQREISLRMDVITVIKILKVLRAQRPHIVHTHTAKAGTSARMAVIIHNLVCRNRIKTVHTFHGHVFEGYFGKAKSRLFIWIERFLAKFTDVVIAISESQKKELAQKFRIAPAKKIRVIELGFDLNPFLENSPLKGQLRRQLGIDDDTLLIGIVGRLVPIKNHFMYLKAAKMFLEKNPGIRTKFIIVGDGEMRDELKAYCRSQDLSEHVCFCGWIRDMPMIYADLDILALTSINEGTPVSVIEAMASLVSVISTNVGGVPGLFGAPYALQVPKKFLPCERGILCRKNDTLGFAEGLAYLVDMDDTEKREMLLFCIECIFKGTASG